MRKGNASILAGIAERIRQERKKLGLTQEELAAKVGVHRTYIGMIERAEKNLSILSLEKIAKALKVPIGDLMKHV